MVDPAVIGTLRIGLEAIEVEGRYERPRRGTATRLRRFRAVRVALAAALRRFAAVLDRPAVAEVAR